MDLENKETILIGDFNCDWSRLVINNAASHTVRMATLASIYQFEQMIEEPTRITATSRTLIDLAFCNKPELITMSSVDHLGISDHSLIYAYVEKYPFHVMNQKLSARANLNMTKIRFLQRFGLFYNI